MGLVQKDAFRTMIISYVGIVIGYLNKGLLFLIILETEEIGLVSLILSLGLLFAQFANMGTVFTTWKFLPFFKNPEKKHHGFFPLMLSLVLIGIAFVTLIYLGFEGQIKSMYADRSTIFNSYFLWVLPIGIGYVLYLFFDVYLRSFYKNILSVFALDICLRSCLTILLFLKWNDLISFNSFVIGHSLIYLIPALILGIYLFKLREFNLSFASIKVSKRFRNIIFQFSSISYINTLGIVLVSSLDIIMIAQFVGLTGTGVYATVVFLTSVTQVPYRSILRVATPLIADYWKHREMEKMKELYVKVSSVSLFIGLTLFLVIWLNIDLVFSFLKPEFEPGIWVFFFLMIGRLVDMYLGLNGAIFSSSNKFKYDIFFTLFLIVAVFVLNLWFIPLWGIAGAAISTSIAIAVYNIGRVIFVWKLFKIHPLRKNQFIIIGLAVITVLVGMYVGTLIDNLWVQFCAEIGIGLALFITPIFMFSLELESKGYAKKVLKLVQSKLSIK